MVNYSESVIYKLCCKDASITDEYIGSTTNKNRRKQQHKTDCNNENRKGYNSYVYQFIRNNGGFENWNLIVLEEYYCENKIQLQMKEREWIELRKPSLNCIKRPIRTQEEAKLYKNEYMKNYQKISEKNKQYKKEYSKNYDKSDKRKEYKKNYFQQIKIKNKSAIIIQQFFKKYFQK